MLALALYRGGDCPCGCGGRSDETLDPANDGKYVVGDPVRCHRRTAIMQAADRYRDSPQAGALLFTTELT